MSEGARARPTPIRESPEVLAGRSALVTGANRGIGRALAWALGGLGVRVLVGARSIENARTVTEELHSAGADAEPVAIDITDDESVAAASEAVVGHGGVDMVVNNAAIKLEHHPSSPSTAPLAAVRETLETNVVGTVRVIQAMLPHLLESDRPRVVNLSSGLGSLTWATTPGTKYKARPLVSYSTSKAALNMVTVLFANEFENTPLRVNAVDPGPVNTPMTQGRGPRVPEQGAQPVVDCLLLPNDGPTGCFFDDQGTVPW